jgi:hypothetical protein
VNHLARILKEQAAQAFTVGTVLLDRAVLTGILFRAWDTPTFERWSAITAVAGLMTLFEFGFNFYINNRLTIEIERGKFEIARRAYATTNFLLLMCMSVSLLCTALFWSFPGVIGLSGDAGGPTTLLALTLLATGAGLRILTCGANSLYRAHRRFARLSFVIAFGELLRMFLTALAALAGGQVLAAALASLIAIGVLQFGFIIFDTSRKFFPHGFPFLVPTKMELREAFVISFGYFAQNVPLTLVTHVPILILAELQAAPGTVAIFILSRTLTNIPRAMLQALGTVAGQECGRRIALADHNGAFSTFDHATRAFVSISGLGAGFLLASGPIIGIVWTGNPEIVRFDFLCAGLAPMLLAPVAVLSHNVLASINAPLFGALGRWSQIFITTITAIATTAENSALGMLTALALGEIVGYAPFAYYGTWRLIRLASLSFHLRAIWICIVSAAFGFLATMITIHLISGTGRMANLAALVVSMTVCSAGFVLIGLTPPLRLALRKQLLAVPAQRVPSEERGN